MPNKSAFTLAEILVTLGIIGVIASMTIPNLVQDIQDAQFKTAYKKAYGIALQSWKQADLQGKIYSVVHSADSKNQINFAAFKSQFNVIKECPLANGSNKNACWSFKSGDENLSGRYIDLVAQGFIDSSGIAWVNGDHGNRGIIFFDINGFAKPNKWGKDRFILQISDEVNTPITYPDPEGGGYPINLLPVSDYEESNTSWCPSGKCYYISWLTGSN